MFQVFVESLDKSFKNVCELDLVFHMDKVRNFMSICTFELNLSHTYFYG